jgi:hypothetical protein
MKLPKGFSQTVARGFRQVFLLREQQARLKCWVRSLIGTASEQEVQELRAYLERLEGQFQRLKRNERHAHDERLTYEITKYFVYHHRSTKVRFLGRNRLSLGANTRH